VENCHRTLGFKKAEEWPEHFSLSDQVLELADIIFDNLGKRNLQRDDLSLCQTILIFIYYKATSSFLAVMVLCDRGLVGDAKTCCRKLIEMMINMTYMLGDRDTRSNQYYHHLPFAMARELKQQERSHKLHQMSIPDRIKAMKTDVERSCKQAQEYWDRDEEGKIVGDFAKKWSGKNLFEMAKASGLENSYINPYLLFCISTHASVDDMINYYDSDKLAFGPHLEHDDIPLVMIEAIRSYWSLSLLVSDAFDMKLRPSFKLIFEKLQTLEQRLNAD
jgi:hypothetical protein